MISQNFELTPYPAS